jgi:hypothetical protein
MHAHSDPRAAFCSVLFPGLGQLIQGRYLQALAACVNTILLVGVSFALGRISGRAAEVFFFMLLVLPWWVFQSYDAYLGSSLDASNWVRTWRRVWESGHDLRFLGFLLVVSALNDTWIILKNLDYLLPFYCTKLQGLPGFASKAISPALHLAVGYGLMRLRRWSLFIYLIYAGYGFTNGVVNLTCFGPGRIRNTLLVAIVLSTLYILWRRHILLTKSRCVGR